MTQSAISAASTVRKEILEVKHAAKGSEERHAIMDALPAEFDNQQSP